MYRSTGETMEKQKSHNPHLNIFNSAGCHGHYLTYLIDRLSNITPKIDQLPFNNLGNSHNKVNYSGFVRFIDRTVHEDYKHLKDTNIIKILYDNNILYAVSETGITYSYNLEKDEWSVLVKDG